MAAIGYADTTVPGPLTARAGAKVVHLHRDVP